MAYFEMIPPTNQKPVENKMHIELNYLHSRNGGFMTPIKKEGELFEEGDLLCVIDDLFGRRVEERVVFLRQCRRPVITGGQVQ